MFDNFLQRRKFLRFFFAIPKTFPIFVVLYIFNLGGVMSANIYLRAFFMPVT